VSGDFEAFGAFTAGATSVIPQRGPMRRRSGAAVRPSERGSQDSNLEPPVLETGVLIQFELLPQALPSYRPVTRPQARFRPR
jgi:hypothetical protein